MDGVASLGSFVNHNLQDELGHKGVHHEHKNIDGSIHEKGRASMGSGQQWYADLEDFEDEESLEAATVEDRLMQEGEARAVRLERMRQEEYMREQESNRHSQVSIRITAANKGLHPGSRP